MEIGNLDKYKCQEDMTYYQLQPLRIMGGWKIEFNYFTEYDLELHDKKLAFEHLTEDLIRLSIINHERLPNLIIDVGWYPDSDPDGCYRLVMVKDCNWSAPLVELKTRSKVEAVFHIEKWVCYDFFSKYI